MTVDAMVTWMFGAAIAFATTRILVPIRIRTASRRLMRTNIAGRDVPAVLGGPLGIGAIGALLCVTIVGATGWDAATTGWIPAAVVAAFVVMFIVGRWDDLRGDEQAQGFRGHLGAATGRRLTGGLVKIAGGFVAGVLCAALLAVATGPRGESVFIYWPGAIAIATFVPLAANLINLLDRAPGRALKVVLLIGLLLAAFGNVAWSVTAAPVLGAAVGVLPEDLREKAMLGDAGANPLGAVLGLGLALSVPRPHVYWWVIGGIVLLALNLASEKWSFSRIIENNRVLRAVDRWGRLPQEETGAPSHPK